MKYIYLFAICLCMSCYEIKRDCTAFKTGFFESTITIKEKDYVSLFIRTESLQVEIFEGKTDSSTVRWINDCEVIFKTINPKSRIEQKDIHLKILETTDSSYTFEYNYVGEFTKQKGIAKRTRLIKFKK